MNKRLKPLLAALALLLLTLIIYTPSSSSRTFPKQPVAEQGILNASLWNFSQYGTFRLDGEWEVYWNQFLEPEHFQSPQLREPEYYPVPKSWDARSGADFATFRLIVQLPQDSGITALRIPPIASAYKLWINGQAVAESGIASTSSSGTVPEESVRTVYFQSSGANAEILFQISNFVQRKGGIWASIEIGNDRQIAGLTNLRNSFDAFIFGCLLLAGIYHISLYWFRRKNKLALYFGLYCFLTSLRLLVVGEVLLALLAPDFPWELSRKIEYIGMVACVPVFLRFLYHSYPAEVSERWIRLMDLFAVTAAVTIAVFPAIIYTCILFLFQAYVLSSVLYMMYVLLQAIRLNRKGAIPFSTAGAVYALTVMNDLLYYNGLLHTGSLSAYGLFIFVIVQTYMLSSAFSEAFAKVEELSRKLLSADRLKDEFLTHTSQELRVPLGTIVGLAESMLEHSAAGMSPVQRSNLSVIAGSGRRLTAMVNDLLDFYQLRDRETIPIRKKPVDLQQMTQVVLSASKPLLIGQNVVLRNDIGPDIPYVVADEAHLQQMLVHLISFSVKQSQSGVIAVSAREAGEWVEICVSNAGVMLSREELLDLREAIRSERLHAGGSEISLATTRQLVQMHGGDLQVESENNAGMTFTFTLPSSRAYTMPIEEIDQNLQAIGHLLEQMVQAGESKSRAPHILIVDDEPVNLQVLYNQLSLEPYAISTATSGLQAIRTISETSSVDLIILDAFMPKMSGFEVCRTIRRHYSMMDLPIMMLYSEKKPEFVYEGFDAGINDYMMKPIDKKELLTRVKTLLTLKQAIREANQHTDELEKLNKQLTELNNNLEEKIAERTLSLQQSKQQLEEMNEDLERIERSRIRLLTNISHDLRTPITSIQGYVEAMLDGVVTEPEQMSKYLRLIHSKSLTLNRLIQDLFELAQLESRQAAFRMREVPAQDLLRQIKEKFELDVSAHGIRFEVQDTLDRPVVLNVDADRLDQVFANLIFNALKYTPRDGLIQIIFEKKTGRAFKDELIVQVCDSGTGVAKEDLPYIFDRFYKGTPRNNAGKGSGLGLAIAKEIVEYHGGRIWADSDTGQGCTVSFTLPIFY
ncbi:ATP-binding protein [Paenibacillus oceani]|uniref:histidine kinase n=1 Tax=Paenibacillus oceani TaxID=2772510 RepID=A0A927C7Z5_9BACL|nr:ATP-binding protein [Paenibacillus oceani]MBD2861712.1 response regulator [Paenibacillus oceani]